MSQPIEHGSTVQLRYTVRDDSGSVVDTNENADPVTYVHGRNEIILGLEAALTGLSAGDERHVTVTPEDGYGIVDPDAITEVPAHVIPREGLVAGTELTARTRDGNTKFVRVKEVRESSVVIDLNHPLAGKMLYFDVRVLDVAPPAR